MDAQLKNELTKSKSANLASALRNFAQSASNTVAENVSAPVDAITWALRKAGMPINKPVMGSEWLAEKGFTRTVNNDTSKIAGEFVGLASPIAFEKSVVSKLAGALRDGLPKNIPLGNMFIGESANTWDAVSAAQAKALEKQGKSPQEIWKETGTFKGVDGKYRQEIPDNKASYDTMALSELKENPNFNYLKDTQPLGGVVEHGELYKAYPNLSDVPVHFMPKEKLGDAYGAYSTKHDRITLKDLPDFDHTKNSLHEIQHAIQQREGFNQGGNLKGYSLDDYSRLAGEAEARATQARINMTPEQRRAVFPLDSYDVPIDQLIFK